MSSHAGLPLLSGPPPSHSSPDMGACRKCSKEFSILFNRQRKCMHCGHAYCSSCTDFQALMPRHGPARGYDPAPVCGYCIEMLNLTALPRPQLRSLPLAKLRRYIDAYNIQIKNPIDKNDFIDAIVNVRTNQGCLPRVNEDYYRKHSVPTATSAPSHSHSSSRNTPARNPSTTNSTNARSSNANDAPRSQRPFPRPDLDPNRQQQTHEMPYRTYTPRSTPNTPRPRTTSAPFNFTTSAPSAPFDFTTSAPSASSTPFNFTTSAPSASFDFTTFAPSAPSTPSTPSTPFNFTTSAPSAPSAPFDFTTPAPFNTGTSRPTGWHFTTSRQSSSRTTGGSSTNPPSSSVPPRPAATSPVPPLPMSTLVTLMRSGISALPVGTLKQILFEGRVRVPPGVVEKEELVERVWAIVEEERRKIEAGTDDFDIEYEDDMDGIEERDEDEEIVNNMVNPEWDAHRYGAHEHVPRQDQQHSTPTFGPDHDVDMREEHPAASNTQTGHPSAPSTTPPYPHSQTFQASRAKSRPPKVASAERSGLCVICQDEEANIAIVDCGHLAMCRSCSDLVLASSRECPLCRTRIVTEARLLRIFKT